MSMCDAQPEMEIDEAALAGLIHAFYARARADEVISGLFNVAITEAAWPRHLDQMVAFWSSVMTGARRYRGNPMAAHMKHREALAPEMFARWLTLWEGTASERLPKQQADAIIGKAKRIAESLQYALAFRPYPVRRDRHVA